MSNEGAVIYQGTATEIYSVKFTITVYKGAEKRVHTIDSVIAVKGNSRQSYFVRELKVNNDLTNLYVIVSVNYSNKLWTIKASHQMYPIAFFNIEVHLQPKGIIVVQNSLNVQ